MLMQPHLLNFEGLDNYLTRVLVASFILLFGIYQIKLW